MGFIITYKTVNSFDLITILFLRMNIPFRQQLLSLKIFPTFIWKIATLDNCLENI